MQPILLEHNRSNANSQLVSTQTLPSKIPKKDHSQQAMKLINKYQTATSPFTKPQSAMLLNTTAVQISRLDQMPTSKGGSDILSNSRERYAAGNNETGAVDAVSFNS